MKLHPITSAKNAICNVYDVANVAAIPCHAAAVVDVEITAAASNNTVGKK